MRKTITFLLAAVLLMTMIRTVSAVDFQEELQRMADKNAKGYIGPFSTAFGTAMNSGLYHTAKPHGLLGFDVSLKAMYVTVPTEAQTFEFYLPETMSLPINQNFGGVQVNNIDINLQNIYTEREVPTVFGSSDGADVAPDQNAARTVISAALLSEGVPQVVIDNIPQSEWDNMINNLPTYTVAGAGFDVLPLLIPQVSVGLIKGTEVMLRFFPETETTPEIGKVGLFGFGIKHNIDQWIPIPLFPVDISAQFVYQKLTVGDFLESKHTNFNVHASKKLGIGISVTPYIGMGFESSTLDVNYTIDYPGTELHGQKVSLSLDGDNGFRMTVGARLGLLIATINVDYSIGEYNVFSAGFGITFR